MTRKETGKTGEAIAERYLKRKGYKILARNFRTRFGEIDLIAEEKGTIAFIEVRTKESARFGTSVESLTPKKLTHIVKASQFYIKRFHFEGRRFRFDVVGIDYDVPNKPRIKLLKNVVQIDESSF